MYSFFNRDSISYCTHSLPLAQKNEPKIHIIPKNGSFSSFMRKKEKILHTKTTHYLYIMAKKSETTAENKIQSHHFKRYGLFKNDNEARACADAYRCTRVACEFVVCSTLFNCKKNQVIVTAINSIESYRIVDDNQ